MVLQYNDTIQGNVIRLTQDAASSVSRSAQQKFRQYMNVLIVEDQQDLAVLICQQLEKSGIKACSVSTGEEALNEADPDVYDLVVLDRGLPDMEGLDVLTLLREEGVKMPVLILTAKDELGDKVDGLNSGADDYLVKPFEMEELIARIRALFRRPSDVASAVFKVGNLEFVPAENAVKVDGTSVDVQGKERAALERLIRLPGRVVSKDSLLSVLYGHGEEGSHNAVEVIIHRLRKRLSEGGANVEVKTLRGIGYILKEKALH